MKVIVCVILFTLGYWSGLVTTCAAVASKVSANKKAMIKAMIMDEP